MIDINTLRFEVQLNKLDNSQMTVSPLVVEDLLDRIEAAEKEHDALRAEVESWKGLAAQFSKEADKAKTHLAFAKDELNHLRTKVEAMEKQEPVAWMSSRNGFIVKDNKNTDYNLPLIHAPGAKGE